MRAIKKNHYQETSTKIKNISFLIYIFLLLPLFSNAQKPICHEWEWVQEFANNSVGSAGIHDIAVDKKDNLYFVGFFRDSLTIQGFIDTTENSIIGTFIGKMDSSGQLLWIETYEGNAQDRMNDIFIGPGGNIFVSGYTDSDTLKFAPGLAVTNFYPNSISFHPKASFCVKFQPDGTPVQLISPEGRGFGTEQDHAATDIVLDQKGNIYLSGYFNSDTLDFGNGVQLYTSTSAVDIFLAKIGPNGNAKWALKGDGYPSERHIRLAYDNTNGKIVISGDYSTNSLSFGPNTLNNPPGDQDIFIAQFDTNGTFQWAKDATYTGGFGVYFDDLHVDSLGNIYISGNFSVDTIWMDNQYIHGTTDWFNFSGGAYLFKFDNNGTLLQNQYTTYGGRSTYFAFTQSGHSYLVGQTPNYRVAFKTNDTIPSLGDINTAKGLMITKFNRNDLSIINGQVYPVNLNSNRLYGSVTGGAGNTIYISGVTQKIHDIPHQFSLNKERMITKLKNFPHPTYSIDSTLPACGISNGGININPQNPSLYDFTYSIDNGQTWKADSVFNNLNAGFYKVVVEDSSRSGCKTTPEPVYLNNVNAPVIGSVQTTKRDNCPPDGTISIFASGGSQPYEYSIDDGQTYKSSFEFDSLVAGTYTIVVRDNMNCKSFEQVKVNRSDNLIDSLKASYFYYYANQIDTACGGYLDSLKLSPYGGFPPYQYSINKGQSYQSYHTFPVETDTTYEVRIKDSLGCIVNDSVTIPAHYYGNCDSVWPGDANANGIANMYDVLNIGIGYQDTGVARNNASTNWFPQHAAPWNQQFSSGVNYNHADCDGNGVIDSFDVDVVNQNYGLTHNKTGNSNQNAALPALQFVSSIDTTVAGQQAHVGVYLGSSGQPVSNVYGLAFQFQYDPAIVDTNSVSVSFDSTWISGASNRISLVKDKYSSGHTDIAYSRINHINTSGYGKVADISYYVQDNIAGKDEMSQLMALKAMSVKVVSKDGNEVIVNAISDSVVVQSEGTSARTLSSKDGLLVYPNPAARQVQLDIQDRFSKARVQLFNQVGELMESQVVRQQQTQLNTAHFERGVYFLRVNTENKVWQRKVVLH